MSINGLIKDFPPVQRMRGLVSSDPTTGMLSARGAALSAQLPGWYNVKAYATAGVDIGLGVASASAAIDAALAAIPSAVQYANGSYSEGGVLYFPAGRYKMTTLLDLSSGETVSGRRVGLTLQGDGIGATVLFSSTLTEMITANTSVDNITIRDMTIYTSAQFTGVGTLECVLNFFGCTNVTLEHVRVQATKSVARNTDCVLINLDQAWSPILINCFTFTNLNTTPVEYHNVDKTANTGIMGGTHIRSRDSNSLQSFGCRCDNAYLAHHSINDDGFAITGMHLGAVVKGFLLDGSDCNTIRDVRFEVHPEDSVYGQYDGPEEHYLVMCDETSRYNHIVGGEIWKLKSNFPNFGYIDKNGTNLFEFTNLVTKNESRPINRNGDFAMGLYTDTTVKIPGWTILGASVLTEETSDLPPEFGITRALKIATTANARGVKTLPFTLDPQKMSVLLWKFWMKRVAGDHTLKFTLSSVASGNPLSADRLVTERGAPALSDNLSGFAIDGTPTWSGGFLTIPSRTKHFLKVNQTATLTGFTVSGTTPNGSHLVSSIADEYTFAVVASDPGTISVVGTYGRSGHDDITDVENWVEYKGKIELKHWITAWETSGLNVIFSCSWAHMIENSVSESIKLWGFDDPLWNTTHTIVSTGGTGSTTFTIVRPIGAADPIDVSSGNSALRQDGSTWAGTAFFGWCGPVGSVVADFRSVFTTGVNTSAENLVAGLVLQPMAGRMEVADRYLPGVETFVAKKTFNWPSCAAAGEQSTTVAVPGAEIGDDVTFGLSVDNASLQKSASILTTGVATCVIYNPTGAPIDLASGVITVTVTHVY